MTAGVRVRTTVAAVLVVGAALIIATVVMEIRLRNTLRKSIEDAAVLTAESIAGAIEHGTIMPVIETGDADEEFVQVVDPAGVVVAATENLIGRTPVAEIDGGDSRVVEDLPFEEGEGAFMVVAAPVTTDAGSRTVLVGRALEPVDESTEAVAGFLVVGIPVLLVVVGAVTWAVVGRALAPVESIRSEVQTISGDQLSQRVPVPEADDEIAHLATTMNVMLDRLEEGRDRQRRLVSDASHELRSPIAAIRQHAEVAHAHPTESDVRELAEVVLAEDLRLQRMVEDLLLLTRIDEGTLALRRAEVDLDDIVLEEASRLRASEIDRRIDSRAVSAGRIHGDAAHLERLVRNLIDNAIRHSDTTVTLSLREAGPEVVFTVD
ncbi:MAG TPA: histidine kinase dimerization/phospho-acceptor domain-containing protein, partial [Actinomycetota bacterium]|nr:histidine kinase dimerization/phospho-acceptor domain-containing protein [Actinomycetota bacterium]